MENPKTDGAREKERKILPRTETTLQTSDWKTPKTLEKERKYDEKKARQREKRLLEPNAGTSAKGYGIFQKDELFNQPHYSRKPKESSKPKAKRGKKVSNLPVGACNESQDAHQLYTEVNDNNHQDEGFSVGTRAEEASKRFEILKRRVEKIEIEAHFERASIERLARKQARKTSDKTWSKRRENVDAGWDTSRDTYLTAFIKHQALSTSEICKSCLIKVAAVRCSTCHGNFCPECDWDFHYERPFHYRELFEESSSRPLLPSECVQSNGHIVEKAVPVPLHISSDCANCADKGKILLVAGSTSVAIVTKDGRFDLRSSIFSCSSCGNVREATPENYIESGYFPGTTSSISCYFSMELIEFWNILKHETPGTSERKFIKTLELISKMRGRYDVINRTHFGRASKEYEFLQYTIRKDIAKLTQMITENDKILFCSACGQLPLAIHLDGNFKLLRWLLVHQYSAASLFGDAVISADSDVLEHVKKINDKKIQRKEKDSCGGSTYTAGRTDASKRKNIAQSGILMASCRHGVVLGAANMERGETYRHVHFLHSKLPSKFFCQDIVCHYWPFAHDVGLKLPEYSKMTTDCSPFLSRWHGKTHSWPCQILWSGHWKKGAAATLGEEQEQVFSTMSRYGSSTKHMSDASRRDHLSSAILYWNERKHDAMDRILVARLRKARYQAPLYRNELQKLLNTTGISEKELPKILEEFKLKAIDSNDKLASSNWPLSYERGDLEGTYLHIKRIERRISLIASTSKERIKMRKSLTTAKTKANALIAEINKAVKECRERKKLGASKAMDVEIEKWGEISEKDFYDGVFPWQTDEIISRKNFDLIDTWMLMQRFEEEIVEVENEIVRYCDALTSQKEKLEREIESLRLQPGSLSQAVRGRIFMLSRELANLKEKIASSVLTFQKLEVIKEDKKYDSSSSSSTEEDESPDCSSAEEEHSQSEPTDT